MDRIRFTPLDDGTKAPVCWHCSQTLVATHSEARYMYRHDGERAIFEDWIACDCGAFQNIRRVHSITIETLRGDDTKDDLSAR